MRTQGVMTHGTRVRVQKSKGKRASWLVIMENDEESITLAEFPVTKNGTMDAKECANDFRWICGAWS